MFRKTVFFYEPKVQEHREKLTQRLVLGTDRGAIEKR